MTYKNGNAIIEILETGSRTITYEEPILLDYPLNIDIRISTSCSFAETLCKDFCHESAVKYGKDCDYEALKSKLDGLPQGIELAIGCNQYTSSLDNFLDWCLTKGYICNLTINQGHLNRDALILERAIINNRVKGLGVSYRSELKWNVPEFVLNYSNTVFHCIVGIDKFSEVLALKDKGVRKILLLGEKDFGFNVGKVDLSSQTHKEWFWWVKKLFSEFEVVSFDNLALEQLKIKRFLNDEDWQTFYNGEYSFYIDAVNQTFSPSSRSNNKVNWDIPIKSYFKSIIYANN